MDAEVRSTSRRGRRWLRRSPVFAGVLALSLAALPMVSSTPGSAAPVAPPPSGVSFTLEGCRLPVDQGGLPEYTLPLNGQVICHDQTWDGSNDDYTTGNLGKSWNELDLVPYRIIVSAGNSAPLTSTFTFAAVLDGFDNGHPGYDVISAPTRNPGSSASCPQPGNGPETTAVPGLGGIDESIFRQVSLAGVSRNTTCVYDFYGRLALGSHLFPGSSLHGNLALIDPAAPGGITTSGIGARDVSIPVKEISPQELRKDMSATQGSDHAWSVTKGATPANLTFRNTCDANEPSSAPVQIRVDWERLPADPSGPVTVVTHVYAENPAARTITVNVTDTIYAGATQSPPLDSANSGDVDVPANTEKLVLTHTFVWTTPTDTALNDVATATYIDKLTGVPVPGTTQATATASVQNTGPALNATAVVNDVESITGSGLTFSADAFSGASGTFDSGYVAGTPTIGPVSWTSATQNGNGSVTFDKTIYVAKGTIEPNGQLADTATLTGSDGFTASASADVDISVNTIAGLTVAKSIPNILQGNETATFTFHVKDATNTEVATPTITFAAGQTSKSVTVPGLIPGVYTVSEDVLAGFTTDTPKTVDLSGAACAGTASFTNGALPATARVRKVTSPGGFEAGWTFTLTGPGVSETVTTTASGVVDFAAQLGEGSYTITEATQTGWSSNGGTGECTFSVNLPADAHRVFNCFFTNTYQPSVRLTKDGDDLSKIGDAVTYTFTVSNTSASGAPAGAPSLVCDVTDAKIGFAGTTGSLPPGGSQTLSSDPFTIPNDATDPFPNTATALCHYPGLSDVVADSSSSHKVELFQPAVKVTKTGPAYSKVGDTVTYNVTIKNTGSADSPPLELASFSDSLVAGVTPPAACNTLDVAESCTFSYTYVVRAGDPDPLVNTATALYHPRGFPNDVNGSASATVDLLHPAFDATKVCVSQPVGRAGPAIFRITFDNTGDADLHVVPSEGAPFDVAAGASFSYQHQLAGPFTGPTVDNTVTGTVTLDPKYELSNSYTFSESASCDVKGLAKVVKTVSGQPPAGQTFTFQLRSGASTASDGTILESATTDPVTGNISFTTELTPGATYQICELVFAGWNTNLSADGPLFVPNSIIPPSLPNPNVNNLAVCANFSVTAGQVRTFQVDNTPPPGGRALTIGFWKNWASCANSNGKGQAPMLDLALGIASAQTTNPPGGLVVSAQNAGSGWPNYAALWYLVLKGDPTSTATNIRPAADCLKTVNLLSKTTVDGKSKKASDPLFNMTAQAVAAELNRFMGAAISGTTITNIDRAVLLNGKYGFNGLTYSPKLTVSDTNLANCLATQLDNYNNNRPVSACP